LGVTAGLGDWLIWDTGSDYGVGLEKRLTLTVKDVIAIGVWMDAFVRAGYSLSASKLSELLIP
jgi:hypothetical protein